MKILYYTSGALGSGRIVIGISIGNAIRRKRLECDYIILSGSPFAYLADSFEIEHIEISLEDEFKLSKDNYQNSELYNTIIEQNPDIIIVDHLWFSLYNFIDNLNCKKIFICPQIMDKFFSIELSDGKLKFRPDDYDLLLAIEPFTCSIPMQQINPIILRNRNEILARERALELLSLNGSERVCLFAFNARPGDFDRVKKKYSHIEDTGYRMVYTTNYEGGLFPAVDYFNAVDLIICGAGYNQFWEVIYFDKEAVFENIPLNFSSTERRIEECQEYYFDENGADQLVDIMLSL